MEFKTPEIKDRVINIIGDISEDILRDITQKILEINVADDVYANAVGSLVSSEKPFTVSVPPIIINLSTYGGSVYDGLGLCDIIRSSDTPIKIICSGKVMSMGIPILLSAQYKIAHRNTTFMIHGMNSGWFGKNQEMKEYIEETTRLENRFIDYILENSKFPKKKMNEIIKSKQDFYFSAEDALKYKIIDEII